MQKNNIRIIVQLLDETAQEFAERLEGICEDLGSEHKVETPKVSFLTSASDGRQTATIQFIADNGNIQTLGKAKVHCTSCEKIVEYSTGVFTCYECST